MIDNVIKYQHKVNTKGGVRSRKCDEVKYKAFTTKNIGPPRKKTLHWPKTDFTLFSLRNSKIQQLSVICKQIKDKLCHLTWVFLYKTVEYNYTQPLGWYFGRSQLF